VIKFNADIITLSLWLSLWLRIRLID